MVPVSDRIWIKPDEVWITGSKIRKDEENKTYYLILSKPELPDSMMHICSILSEFGTKEFYTQARKEYFKEHYSLFIPSGAIEKLSKL